MTNRRALADIVNKNTSVAAAHDAFLTTLNAWWQEHLPKVEALAPADNGGDNAGDVYALRRSLLAPIEQTFAANKLLTDHQIRGAFARYVGELRADLKSVVASGWGPELIPDADILESQFPEVLAEMETKRIRIAKLAALFSTANDEDYEDTDDTGALPGDQVKALKNELKELKAQYKESFKELKILVADLYTELRAMDKIPKGVKKDDLTVKGNQTAPEFLSANKILELFKTTGHVSDLVGKIQDRMQYGPQQLELAKAREERLVKQKALEDEAKELKADLRATEKKQDELVAAAREKINRDEARKVIIERLHKLLVQTYESYLRADQRACLAALENLHNKYAVTAEDIEQQRDVAMAKLKGILGELGYT